MPIYEYSALNIKGKTVTDIIDSESIAAARQKLRAANIYPTSIKEVYETDSPKKTNLQFLPQLFLPKVKQSEMAMMTRQLATLITAGFPLVSAIYTLIPQTGSNIFKRILSQIKDSIEEGSSFADALSQYPDTFSDMYINMVRSGESSGTLELVLERLADISEKQQALNNRIRSALTYPVLMFFLGVLVLYFLMAYVVPRITSIFSDMGQVLPAPTRFLIATSEIFKSGWWVILLGIFFIIIGISRLKKSEKGMYWYDKTKLSLPGIGALTTKLAVARFARTLGTLLENGVSLLQALGIVKNIVGNRLIADSIETAANDVEKGNGLGKSLETSKIFPHISIQMIQVGEQSGELETLLNKVADIYENEVETTVVGLSTLLEPVIILFMGVVVLFIVLSILLPIFEMNQLVR
ncbi:MAG: type II secretion system inner membrane protein GspF [Desulfobacteraceae bacterium]|nr:type II secretion system inner membrane protein GspF [Desulfobacteraceae bacterium]MBC2755772.1 type II secretion system inner membrane protein GspF [Desulfobacteraceae bacterium]